MYRERLKLMHACIFFVENCADVGRMKLYKLLFLLDFEHYRALGRSVTGLEYEAWGKGPVPASFDQEWKNGLASDIAIGLKSEKVIKIHDFDDEDVQGYPTHKLVPRIDFAEGLFSRKEMDLLHSLAKQYFNKSATEMSKESHVAFGYWDEIWNFRNQPNGEIPYDLVFERQNTSRDQLMREFSEERQRFAELSK